MIVHPLVIGHRANTTRWIRRYLSQGAHGVEIDLYRKGEEVRVGHPLDKKRPVLLRERIARILLGFHIFRPVTIREAVGLIGDRILWLDLKDPETFVYLREVKGLRSLGSRLIITTRFHDEVPKIKDLFPMSTVLLSLESLPPRLAQIVDEVGANGISIKFDIVDRRSKVVYEMKTSGLEVGVWVVNDKEQIERVVNWGVNYVVTDLVSLALRYVAKAKDVNL